MDDLISRQAAIETAVSYIEEWNGAQSKFHRNRITERFLNLPSAQPEITEKQVKEYCEKRCLVVLSADFFHHLQSAQPERCEDCGNFNKARLLISQSERKKGKWIIVTDSRGRHAECPYCGEWKYHSNQKFCGECGAQMEGEDE